MILRWLLFIAYYWQHHGNKKSDSPYYLNNEKNTNTLSEILSANLFRKHLTGANGNKFRSLEKPDFTRFLRG